MRQHRPQYCNAKIIFLLIGALLLAACSANPNPKPFKKPGRAGAGSSSGSGSMTITEPPPPPSATTTAAVYAPAPAAATSGPKYQASQKLVSKGIAALQQGRVSIAMQNFQDAINVDSNNGEAYYYLAKAYVADGQPEMAQGALDKAQLLLGSDPSWQDRISQLRFDIKGDDRTLEDRRQNLQQEETGPLDNDMMPTEQEENF